MKKIICFIISCVFVLSSATQAYAIQLDKQRINIIEADKSEIIGDAVTHSVFVDRISMYKSISSDGKSFKANLGERIFINTDVNSQFVMQIVFLSKTVNAFNTLN